MRDAEVRLVVVVAAAVSTSIEIVRETSDVSSPRVTRSGFANRVFFSRHRFILLSPYSQSSYAASQHHAMVVGQC